MGRLDGKVALVSGGGGGLGAAISRLFAAEGARVVVGAVRDAAGAEVASAIGASGGHARFVHLDVTSERDWRDAVAAAVSGHGRLDVLVNNAGIWRGGRVEETSVEHWDAVNDVNSKGVFLGTRAAIPAMRAGGGGSIVNVSSISGIVGNPRTSAYAASKGAIRVFTKATAIQYAPDGIRANSIHPGPIDTDLLAQVVESLEIEEFAPAPLGRVGKAEDVAFGALYLASDESSYDTRSDLVIDGGATPE
ncbi:MAG: glucose 1-dehydrogenase [Chloroflexi bacterium]|nr:glucose 1-dehydrogenase [Chloroflexota bacterium]